MDRVRALKYESPSTGGTQTNEYPTELDPMQDYLASKGISFEGSDSFAIEKLGRTIVSLFPTTYQQVTYSSGNVSALEFYNSASFITANRLAKIDFTYSSGNLTSEELKIYNSDGVTIVRTYTWTHTYSGGDFSSSGLVIT